ncbi:MAG: hypothetical protein F6K09_32240, partial [Merismopedia sp. SIO2A8]|nr:hypothetical protein [Merismopedia sp. SIO2A8]
MVFQQSRSQAEKTLDQGFIWLTRIFALGVAAILIWIAFQVGMNAFPAIKQYGLGFLLASGWNPVKNEYGAFPMIYGTLVSSALALLLAVPLGGEQLLEKMGNITVSLKGPR